MTKYQILTASTSGTLDAAIKDYVAKGWNVQGGVAVSSDPRPFSQYAVLMVKEERGVIE